MKTHRALGVSIALVTFFVLPSLTFAAGSATINGLYPATGTVGVGTPITFSVVSSGFTNPSYYVIDSFGGGVSNANINQYGDVSWTPNNSDIGSHTITITVSDSSGNTATVSQTITVATQSISIGSVTPGNSARYGTPVSFVISNVGFISPQYSVADTIAQSTITTANTDGYGNFHWTPLYQDIGTHTIVATARDYAGHFSTTSVQITITGPTSVALSQVSPSTSIYVGSAVSFTATTTGLTNPSFTIKDAFSSTLGTSSLAIDSTGHVTWKPIYNDIGSHLITINASDSSQNTASASITLQVIPGAPVMLGTVVASTITLSVVTTTAAPATVATPASSAPSAYVFKNYLQVGSSGKDVLALQQLLASLGFFTLSPTGYFGSITMASVQSYQNAHNISPLGVVGPLTRTSLNTGK